MDTDKFTDKGLKILLYIALGVMAKYIYTFSFSIDETIDVSINLVALPAIIASFVLGPVPGAFIGGSIDLIGHILHPMGPFMFSITIVAILRGFLPGFLMQGFFKNENYFLTNLIYCIGLTLFITQVILMPVILHSQIDIQFFENVSSRLLTLIFTMPIYVGISYLIIKQNKIKKELKNKEEQISSMFANVPEAIFRCRNDEQRTISYISDYIKKITGFPAADFLNNKMRSYNSIIHQDDRLKVFNIINDKLSKKEPYTLNYRIISAAGDIRYIYEKGEGIFSKKGELLYIDGSISDVTEITQKEEQLQRTKKDLIVTQERNRIARELHDSVSQSLHGINYSIQSLKQLYETGISADFTKVINHLEDGVEDCLKELKNMIAELKPTALEGKGLSLALVALCETFAERTNINLTHDIDKIKNMTPEQELAVYRILQEGLTNIQKHSGADQVRVFFKEIENRVFLTLADNGKGFNEIKNSGYGLDNMKNRAFQNHGKLEIESSLEKGTVIRVSFEIIV